MFTSLRACLVTILAIALAAPVMADETKQPEKKAVKKAEEKTKNEADKKAPAKAKGEADKHGKQPDKKAPKKEKKQGEAKTAKAEKKPAAKAEKKTVAKGEKKPAAKGEKGQKKVPAGIVGPFQMPKGIKLSPDQEAQLASVQQKYLDKLRSVQQVAKLSKDQAAKRKEALKNAQAKGHKGKSAQALADDAIGLSSEQRAAREKLAVLRKEIETAKRSILTEEQKASLRGKKKATKAS